MLTHETSLIDRQRYELFSRIVDIGRLLRRHGCQCMHDGQSWTSVQMTDQLVAVPTERLCTASMGRIAEKLLLIVHASVRDQRKSCIRLPNELLKKILWRNAPPKNWLDYIRRAFSAISHLRVADRVENMQAVSIVSTERLFTKVAVFKKERIFEVIVAPAFLGCLEEFAQDGAVDDGVVYRFPKPDELRSLRKSQSIVDVYLPVFLAENAIGFCPSEKRLVNTIFRELTKQRGVKSGRANDQPNTPKPSLIQNATLVGWNGKQSFQCRDLDENTGYAQFNGNGKRRGQGYKLSTWMSRAGFLKGNETAFLKALDGLSTKLGLVCVFVSRGDRWTPLRDVLINRRVNRRAMVEGHMRIYVSDRFDNRWKSYFGWTELSDPMAFSTQEQKACIEVETLRSWINEHRIQQQQVAKEMKVSKQYLSAVMAGRKPCSPRLRTEIAKYMEERDSANGAGFSPPTSASRIAEPAFGAVEMLTWALRYHDFGWTVIPVQPGEKKPYIRWKEYQVEQPSRECIVEWWTKWPDANIAAVLGKRSNLFCIDVDGQEPHRILQGLVDALPQCPSVKSGSEDPCRYHLFFEHPEIETKSKQTPWNRAEDKNRLELRGEGGIVVLPPSQHNSGRRYAWCDELSFDEIKLPPTPDFVIKVLNGSENKSSKQPARQTRRSQCPSTLGSEMQLASSTTNFLSGKLAESPNWNSNIFKSACDLNSQNVPKAQAIKEILKAANPHSQNDIDLALKTIESAYACDRDPSRC